MQIKNLIKGLFVVGILLSASPVFAQEQMQQQQMQRKTPEEKAGRQLKWMQTNLMLSEDQSRSAYNILLATAQDEDSADAGIPPGREKAHEKKAIKRDAVAEMKQVLSPDQFQRYIDHLHEQREKQMQRKQVMQGNY